MAAAANAIEPAAKQAAIPGQSGGSAAPSVIIVEVLGYGGGTDEDQTDSEKRKDRQSSNGYDTNNVVRLLGNGTFDAEDLKSLTAAERNALAHQIATPAEP